MQQARKHMESTPIKRDVPTYSNNQYSRQKPNELRSKDVANDQLREWKPEDESFVFNIRPGRRMFPFLKHVIEAKSKCRENDINGDVNIEEQTRIMSEVFENSGAPSDVVLTRDTASFVCEFEDQDEIVEVI